MSSQGPNDPQHPVSPDGNYVWNGDQWVPAGPHFSPDGNWFWDGSVWVPSEVHYRKAGWKHVRPGRLMSPNGALTYVVGMGLRESSFGDRHGQRTVTAVTVGLALVLPVVDGAERVILRSRQPPERPSTATWTKDTDPGLPWLSGPCGLSPTPSAASSSPRCSWPRRWPHPAAGRVLVAQRRRDGGVPEPGLEFGQRGP